MTAQDTEYLRQILAEIEAGLYMRTTGTSTGTGAEQTIPHGLGALPKMVDVFGTGSNGIIAAKRADTTNIYLTVPAGETYVWVAQG
jgi:hypothetical protein